MCTIYVGDYNGYENREQIVGRLLRDTHVTLLPRNGEWNTICCVCMCGCACLDYCYVFIPFWLLLLLYFFTYFSACFGGKNVVNKNKIRIYVIRNKSKSQMVCFNQMALYKEPRKRRILYSWFSNQIVSNCFLFFSDNLLPKTESQSNNLKKNLPPSTLCINNKENQTK